MVSHSLFYQVRTRLLLLLLLAAGSVFMLKQVLVHPVTIDRPPFKQDRAYGHFPLTFEPNRGQSDESVRFLARGDGYQMFLTPREVALTLWRPVDVDQPAPVVNPTELIGPETRPTDRPDLLTGVLRMQFLDANPQPVLSGESPLSGTINYYVGDDPADWQAAIPTYQRVRYQGLYPGIDLEVYGFSQQPEYDFVVAPGADPDQIRLGFYGVLDMELDEEGNLILETAVGRLIHQAPRLYQMAGSEQQPVAGRYQLLGQNEVGFAVGEYDSRRPLIIDPVVFSTFLGGGEMDIAYGIAVDNFGASYVTGYMISPDFPTVPGSYTAPTPSGFIVKLNPAGTALEYSALINGTGLDIAVDDQGNAYAAGRSNYSTGFALKLSADGTTLLYRKDSLGNEANGIAVDASGAAYVVGATDWPDFTPTPGAFQTTYGGWYSDAFIARLNGLGQIQYGSYLGGDYDDTATAVAVDAQGNAYVTGFTYSWTGFPLLNPFQAQKAGSYDAFLTKVTPDGSALHYSTYFGGVGRDFAYDIALDSSDRPHLTGHTMSGDLPLQNPFQSNLGVLDAFVTKFDANAASLVFSTFLGGYDGAGQGSVDEGSSIAVDQVGNVIITGRSEVATYPVTGNAPQGYFTGGFYDVIVSQLSPDGSELLYSTYLGGILTEEGRGVAVGLDGAIYVTGNTTSFEFPTVNPFQDTKGVGAQDGNDAFITKLNHTAPAEPLVDLELDIDDSSNIVHGNDPVTYTLSITNNGPDQAAGLELIGRLPFLNFVGWSATQGDCTDVFAVYHIVCDLGLLDAGQVAEVTFTILAPNVNAGSFSIDAFLNSHQLDIDNRSNWDREVTTVSDNIASLDVSVTGSGTVRSTNVLGIDCPPDCRENYVAGQWVTLQASPGPGQQFLGWGGACSGAGGCSVHMDQNQSVSAAFSAGPPTPTPPPPSDVATIYLPAVVAQ